ncbi:MAG: AraC family transcriptional regulator [Ferruginibacter sp.]
MEPFNLPDDIFPDQTGSAESIIFHDYSAAIGSFKGRSILNKNAISLVIRGEKTMHFAEKTVHVNMDEFHFLSAGNCLASMNLSDKTIFRSILIFFDNKILADFYLRHDGQIAKIKSKQKLNSEPYISFKKDEFVLNFINSLLLLLQTKTQLSQAMKLLKFEELMLYLLERYPLKLLSFQNEKHKDFDDLEIRKAVEVNITSHISIDELAFLCNTSVSTFKRRFEKIYGTSPNKWMLNKRMELAKQLLMHGNERPAEVYHKVGYENHSSFSQSFKQVYGMKPKEFQMKQMIV